MTMLRRFYCFQEPIFTSVVYVIARVIPFLLQTRFIARKMELTYSRHEDQTL